MQYKLACLSYLLLWSTTAWPQTLPDTIAPVQNIPSGHYNHNAKDTTADLNIDSTTSKRQRLDSLQTKYHNRKPQRCSEKTSGIVYRVDNNHYPPDTTKLFLTLDACVNGYDSALIKYLVQERIQATLFVTARWIHNNKAHAKFLASHLDLFDIQNHGTRHRPASVYGCTCYGIEGTRNAKELIAEVQGGARAITSLTGVDPILFRPGTAFADNVAVELLKQEINTWTIGYSIAADDGGMLNRDQVKERIIKAQSGDIILLHMNTSKGENYNGFKMAYAILQEEHQNIQFQKLANYTEAFIAFEYNVDSKIKRQKNRRQKNRTDKFETLEYIIPIPCIAVTKHANLNNRNQ